MKLRIKTLTIFLFVILLTGCDGNKQERQQPEKVEVPTEPKKEDTPIVEVNKQAGKPVTIDPTLPVSLEGLPTAFPDSVMKENKENLETWNTIFKECVKNPTYMEHLIPKTAKEANELNSKLIFTPYNAISKNFRKLYAQAMFEKFPSGDYPDDINLLRDVVRAWTPNPNTPREDVLIFIGMHEHIKELCDHHNVPSTSQWRAVRNLTNAYAYVGEYRKAAQNERELWGIVDHAKETGEYHEGLFRCLSTKPIFWLEEKALEQEQQQKQSK